MCDTQSGLCREDIWHQGKIMKHSWRLIMALDAWKECRRCGMKMWTRHEEGRILICYSKVKPDSDTVWKGDMKVPPCDGARP